MPNNELRKLNRKQLLEILLIQTKQINDLNARIAELEKKLADREIVVSEAGNIAEAALRLNGVFEAAQSAADQYLDNVKKLSAGGKMLHIPVEFEE